MKLNKPEYKIEGQGMITKVDLRAWPMRKNKYYFQNMVMLHIK